jgi:hypothetical protein
MEVDVLQSERGLLRQRLRRGKDRVLSRVKTDGLRDRVRKRENDREKRRREGAREREREGEREKRREKEKRRERLSLYLLFLSVSLTLHNSLSPVLALLWDRHRSDWRVPEPRGAEASHR